MNVSEKNKQVYENGRNNYQKFIWYYIKIISDTVVSVE